MKSVILFSFLLCNSAYSYEFADIPIKELINSDIEVPSSNLKEWTVAIYMNGRSNIEPFALKDFNRFETIGSSVKVNIVVEIGRSKGIENDTVEDGNWSGVRRYYVKKDNDKEHINSQLLAELGEIDMGNWREAASFLLWAKKNYPARKYMFIIWDHGWGWIDPKEAEENLLNKSISHDFVSGNYIKATELPYIFKIAGPVELYASMACFMQMAEVSYEIKDYAKVIVGSEEVIQLPSFNFEDFLSLLTENPYADARQAGLYLVDTFKEMYSRPEYQELLINTKYGTQLSAINPLKLETFAEHIKEIGKILIRYPDINAISKAKKDVLRFEVGDEITDPDKTISFYADIYHFLELILTYSRRDIPEYIQLSTIFTKLKSLIDNELVIKNVFLNKDRTGKDYSNTHGISMHIPGKKGNLINYHQTYHHLSFDKATNWSQTIKFLEGIE